MNLTDKHDILINRAGAWWPAVICGLAALAPTAALAQGAFNSPASTSSMAPVVSAPSLSATTDQTKLQHLMDALGGHPMLMIGGLVLFVVLLIAAFVFMWLGRHAGEEMGENFSEPEAGERSQFEQILAEVQGISLRIHGGDTKGYYRKIEQLARIYLERLGYKGAREMSGAEIDHLVSGGGLPPKQAAALSSIIERCRLGAEHENQKPEISTNDLLRDLRMLIKQTEEAPAKQAS